MKVKSKAFNNDFLLNQLTNEEEVGCHFPQTAVKGKRIAMDISRFPDLGSRKLRVFTSDYFYQLSEVEGETVEKKGEEGFRGFRTKVAVVVEDEMTSAWETT